MNTPPSREERQDEKRLAAPPGRFLHRAALRQPRLRCGLVIALDGERGEALVARNEQLRLAHRLRDGQRLAVDLLTALEVAATLVDLGQDDERHGQMAALP